MSGVFCYDTEFKCGIIPKTLKMHRLKTGHKTVNISLIHLSFWLLKKYSLKSREDHFRHNKEDKKAVTQQDKAADVAGGSQHPPALCSL